jgi:hypothetical protein
MTIMSPDDECDAANDFEYRVRVRGLPDLLLFSIPAIPMTTVQR